MKIRSVGAELLLADGRTDGRTDGWTDTTKLMSILRTRLIGEVMIDIC